MLHFVRAAEGRVDRVGLLPSILIIAGWAGRDEAALKHHIEELAAIGVPRPSSVPVFYRCAAATVTQSPRVEVLGPDSSGEVEPVIVAFADGLWLGLGSDHTDRKAETQGIALSKQLCPKPIGDHLWRLHDVLPHWDQIEIRSHALIEGQRVLYQEGRLSALRPPPDLIARFSGERGLPAGAVMFGGTLAALGGIRPADRFEMELVDPVLKRRITHAYDVAVLPVVT